MKRFYKFLMPLVAIVALALPWNARAQVTVTIGSGTATNSYLPTYEFYNYSLSQQIYTAEEIDMVGTINSISFYTGGSATRTLAIYMVNTTKTSFSGPTDWIVPTANDQVFSGSVTYVANGWTTITLTTPFVYDGSNLAVIVDDNTGSYVSSIAKRVFTPTASGNCALRIYSDGTNYNALAPSSYSGTTMTQKNQIQLEIIPGNISCWSVRNLTASGIDPWNCTLSWLDTNNSGPTYVIVDMADTSELATTTDTFYTFTNLVPDTTYHFGVFVDCGGDSTRINLINVTTPPACAVVTNLSAFTTAGSAILTWTPSISDNNSTNIVEYRADTADTWIQLGSFTDPTATISGLEPGTAYVARVAGYCFSEYTSNWQTVHFTTASLPCTAFDPDLSHLDTLGNGTSTTSYFPTYSLYNYSYTQQIFTPTELGGGGVLNSIAVMPTTVNSQRNIEIYVGHVNVATSSSWLNPADLTLVYTGTTQFVVNQWYTFEFDTPFAYNGSDNLLIVFRDQTGTWTSSNAFQCTSGTSGVSCYVYQDGSAYTVPPSTSGTSSSNRNNMIFNFMACAQTATCAAPYVLVDNVEATEVTVNWIPGYGETSWDVEYRLGGDSTWTTAEYSTSATSYTFTNLTPSTDYEFRVVNDCTDTIFATVVTVTTPCLPETIPFYEDFESYATGSGNLNMGSCWYTRHLGYSSGAYPYVNTLGHNSSKSLYFYYAYSNSYASWITLPQMADSLRNLELSFWEYKTSDNYGLIEVGIMTDPTNINTFVPVKTVQPTANSVWENFLVNFRNYNGPEGRITLMMRTSSSYYAYVDDIEVSRYSTCPRPGNLIAVHVTDNAARLSWLAADSAESYLVKWSDTNNFSTATDSAVVYTGTTFDLSGLNANTTYYAWVATDCGEEQGAFVRCSFTTAASCNAVENLTVRNVTHNSAVASWDAPTIGTANYYRVLLASGNTQLINTTTTNNYMFLTGLDTMTTYTLTVMANCGTDSVPATANFTTGKYGMIGTGEVTAPLPTYPYYNYSISEQLWLNSELSIYGDTIYGIYFRAVSAISDRPMMIWVANTSLTDLSTTSNIPSTDMTLVMDSTYDIAAGWNYFPFSTPFVRTANSNMAVMVTDEEDYDEFSGWYSGASAVNSLYGYNDNNAYSTTDLSDLTATAYRAQMQLNASLIPATCAAPLLAVAGSTGSSVTLAWTAGLNETSWSVEYRLPGDTVWTTSVASTSATTATVDNLTSGTTYVFRVGSLCGSQTIYATINATTTCGTPTLPFYEDFDYYSGSYLTAPCWYIGTTNNTISNTTYPYVANLIGEGPMLRLYQGAYVSLPEFSAPLNTLQVRVKYLAAYNYVPMLFGYMTDPEDINTFTLIDTFYTTVENEARFLTIQLDSLPSDAEGRLTFYTPMPPVNYTFIDELTVELIPTCQAPDSVSFNNITTTTADVSWQMGNGLTPSSYKVFYRAYGETQFDSLTVTTTSATLTNLNPGMYYEVQVSAVCSATDESSLTPIVRFTTECAATMQLPYNENFDGYPVPASYATGVMPNCWTIVSTTASSSDQQPQIYYGNAGSGSYSLRLYYNSIVALPQMDTTIDALQLSFRDYVGSTYYSLVVGVLDSLSDSSAFHPVDTITVNTTGANNYTFYMAAAGVQNGYIAFKNIYTGSSSYSYSYHYLDNIEVSLAPSCLPVTDITAILDSATSITLNWNDPRPATEWEVSYSTTPLTDPNLGTILPVSAHPFVVDNLSDANNYYFYIRTVCGAGDSSEWTAYGPVRCHVVNMHANQTDTLYMCGGTLYDDGGPDGNYSASQQSYVVLMPSMPGAFVTLNGTAHIEGSSWDNLYIYDGIGTSGTALVSLAGQSYSSGTTVSATSSSGPLTVYFKSDGSVQYSGFALNVGCLVDPCGVGDVHVNVAASTSTSVNLEWTGTSTSYQIEYGVAGFTEGTGTTISTTSNSTVISGLTSLANYDFRVRGLCNQGDTGFWHNVTYTMPMCDNVVMVENFDSTLTTTGTSTYVPIGYSLYDYGYVQTIVDSAYLANAGLTSDITAFAFNAGTITTGSQMYENMTVFLSNVSENNLSSGWILPNDSNHVFVKVIDSADFNFTESGWQIHNFDTAFTWDGHSNILVSVKRDNGDYSGSQTFTTHTHPVAKTRYAYRDNTAFDYTNPGVTGTALTTVGDLRFYSCSGGCPAPAALTTTNVTYNAATITWSGSDSTEVGIHQGLWDESGATMANVTPGVHTYTFTSLTPNTQYTVAARTLCEDNMTSNWVYVTFTTDDLPCFAPTNIQVSNETTNGGKITWTPGGNETEWIVNVFRTGIIDTNYTVINTPMCNVSGLYAATTYTISVASVCGGIDTVWCDTTATLTTTACLPPTNVEAVANGHNAMVTWTSSGANEYHVLWYVEGFTTGADSVVVTNGTTNATITGLEQGETYDIYVYAYCDGQRSAQAGQTQVTITGIDDINSSLINLYPNPANTTVTVDGIQGEAIVTIVDMNGRTVFSEKAVSKLTIDLGGMAQGAYFVRITGENTTAIRKLIVK